MPRDGSITTGIPRSRAASMPGASARFEITTAITASSVPAAIASAIATTFEARPPPRTPRRLYVNHPLDARRNHGADGIPVLLQPVEHLPRLGQLPLRHNQNHADAQVERAPPVVLRDP